MKALLLILAVASAGCAVRLPNTIVAEKSTVFGLDLSSDATGRPHVRFGLIRYFTQVVPVSTNELHAPAYSSDVAADVTLTKQNVKETFSTK